MRKNSGNQTVEPFREKKDIERMKKILQGSPRDLCLLTVGINFGLRASDLLSLKWPDLLVTKQSKKQVIRQKLRITEKKTGKTATILVPPSCRKAIESWWRESGCPIDGYVFPSRKSDSESCSRPLSVSSFHALVNKWADDAGVQGHFGTHSLRKTFGYFFRMAGGSIELLMERFSHSSPAITRRYIGITDDEVAAIALKVDL